MIVPVLVDTLSSHESLLSWLRLSNIATGNIWTRVRHASRDNDMRTDEEGGRQETGHYYRHSAAHEKRGRSAHCLCAIVAMTGCLSSE